MINVKNKFINNLKTNIMKIFTLILLLCVAVMVNAANITHEFNKTGKAPVIDGIVDENDPWDEASWMDLAFNKAGVTTTDMSAKMQLLFSKDIAGDAGFIYVVVNVSDETPNNDPAISNTYERDCVEYFFGVDTNAYANAGAYKTAGDLQLRIQREHPDGIEPNGNYVDGSTIATNLKASADFKWAVETNSSEYTQELQIPMSVLGAGAAFDGKSIRLDIQVADNTTGAAGGRTQQTYWNSAASDNQWKDTRDFGIAVIGAKTVGVKNVAAAKGTAFVKNNMLNVNNVNGTVAIYDLKGSMMRKATINGKGSIDIADMKAGMYIVKGNDIAVKFVK
jgi:hypothetical protein